MEDAILVLENIKPGVHFFGVFDGHGGDAVALYVKKHLPTLIKQSRHLAQSNYDKVFEEVFRKIDTMMDSKTAQDELRQLFKNGQATKEDNENTEGLPINHAEMSGCTACCAIITIDKIFVGNLGDSRAVLAKVPGADSALPADALEAVEMSVDMKPDLESERQRIIAAGGMVLMGRVDGNLSLSAAIGDKQYKERSDLPPEKQKVTIVPQVKTHNLNKDVKFLLIACDGIWDCRSSQETVNFFTKTLWKDKKKPISQPCAKEELADAVGQLFLENCTKPDEARPDGKDNMSCVLIEFKKGFDKVAGTLSKPAGKPTAAQKNSAPKKTQTK